MRSRLYDRTDTSIQSYVFCVNIVLCSTNDKMRYDGVYENDENHEASVVRKQLLL